MLKKIFTIAAIVAVGGYLLTPFSPCDQPLRYKIGGVDSKFKISEEQFKSNVDQAGQIWSKAYGKPLFTYDPQASLTISMVYDGRQSLSNQINQLEDNLTQQKDSISPQIKEYEKQSAEFKKKLDDLNKEIESWNQKGGAPADVYEQLTKRQKELKSEGEQLNALAKSLNRSTDEYNSQVSKLDQTVDKFNETLQFKPEEGIFDPARNAIEVYFYINQNELTHTLAHEMGHSLGMDHNQNSKSILFPKTTKALTPSTDDLAALKEACRQRTLAEVIRDRLIIVKNFYFDHS